MTSQMIPGLQKNFVSPVLHSSPELSTRERVGQQKAIRIELKRAEPGFGVVARVEFSDRALPVRWGSLLCSEFSIFHAEFKNHTPKA